MEGKIGKNGRRDGALDEREMALKRLDILGVILAYRLTTRRN